MCERMTRSGGVCLSSLWACSSSPYSFLPSPPPPPPRPPSALGYLSSWFSCPSTRFSSSNVAIFSCAAINRFSIFITCSQIEEPSPAGGAAPTLQLLSVQAFASGMGAGSKSPLPPPPPPPPPPAPPSARAGRLIPLPLSSLKPILHPSDSKLYSRSIVLKCPVSFPSGPRMVKAVGGRGPSKVELVSCGHICTL